MKRKSFRFTLLASAMLAAMTLTGCSNDDNPVDTNPTTPTEQEIFANMVKISAPAYISDVTNAYLKEAINRRFTNQTSLDNAQIAVVTPQEIGTYDGKLKDLYDNGGLIVILKPNAERYKAFVEKYGLQYTLPSVDDNEMLLFAFNNEHQYYTIFANDTYAPVSVKTTGHDDDGKEIAEQTYTETPNVIIDAAYYVEQTNLFAKWANDLYASKARTRGSDGYNAAAIISHTTISGDFSTWALYTTGYYDTENISATAKVSYKISVTPLYIYNYAGAESQHGDYYAIQAELTAHNKDIFKFTHFDRTGAKADDYIMGFFMEKLKATFEMGGANKKSKNVAFYENPAPETTELSTTYSSSQTMGFNVSLNGGMMGPNAQAGIGGGFNASWTQSQSMTEPALVVQRNFETTGKVEYQYIITGIKEEYPHKGSKHYKDNMNGIFYAEDDAYIPGIAISSLTLKSQWIWYDNSASDNSTDASQIHMTVAPQYGDWDWRYGSKYDRRVAFNPEAKEVWQNLPVPDRTRFGVLALRNGHTGLELGHIKVYNQSDNANASAVAEIPSTYGHSDVAKAKLKEGTYRVTFDLMSGTTVKQSLKIENITIKGALTESASTTEVATNDGK